MYKSTELEADIDSKKQTRHRGLNSNTHKSDKHSVLPCRLCKYLVSDQQQDQITGLRPILIWTIQSNRQFYNIKLHAQLFFQSLQNQTYLLEETARFLFLLGTQRTIDTAMLATQANKRTRTIWSCGRTRNNDEKKFYRREFWVWCKRQRSRWISHDHLCHCTSSQLHWMLHCSHDNLHIDIHSRDSNNRQC